MLIRDNPALLNLFGVNVFSVSQSSDFLKLIQLSRVITPVWRSYLAATPESYCLAIQQHDPQAGLDEESSPWTGTALRMD